MSLQISGYGTATPASILTNDELEERFRLEPGWIEKRTGILQRRIARTDESTATLATNAARDALNSAEIDPDKLDLIVVATSTPEQPIPHTAAFVSGCLGSRCGALDVNAACTGFVTAFLNATTVLQAARGTHALIIGADTYSRIIDPHDRSTAVIFGDAAAALVLGKTPNPGHGLLAWDLGCDPSQRHLVELAAGGSRRPTTLATLATGANHLHMAGRAVADYAVPALIDSARRTLRRGHVSVADITAYVPHQANARILERVADGLGLDQSRVITNVERYGNTSAASIPLALAEAARRDAFRAGDLVLISAIGAGMTWGSLLLRW